VSAPGNHVISDGDEAVNHSSQTCPKQPATLALRIFKGLWKAEVAISKKTCRTDRENDENCLPREGLRLVAKCIIDRLQVKEDLESH
jgi:hypothetical protein